MEGAQLEKPCGHERPRRMISSSPAEQRIPALDGLRALAILLVFLRHAVYLFTLESAAPLPDAGAVLTVMMNGWIGVDLFFVLSGYLITSSLLKTGQHDWKRYVQKRVLRIVPAYVAVLFLCVLGAFPLYQMPQGDMLWRIFYHLLFLQDYLPANINVVFWSLGVEEKFYIVAPFLIFWLAKRQHVASWLLAVIAGGYVLRLLSFYLAAPQDYGAFFETTRAPFHTNLETLLLGVAIAFWRTVHAGKLSPKAAQGIFWLSLGALAALMASHEMMRSIGWFDVLVQPLLIAGCMAGLVLSVVGGYSGMVLQGGVARFLSRISYSFYLVHFPLVYAAFFLWQALGSSAGPAVFGVYGFWIYGGVYLLISLAAATALYYAVEKPFLDIKARLDHSPAPQSQPRSQGGK